MLSIVSGADLSNIKNELPQTVLHVVLNSKNCLSIQTSVMPRADDFYTFTTFMAANFLYLKNNYPRVEKCIEMNGIILWKSRLLQYLQQTKFINSIKAEWHCVSDQTELAESGLCSHPNLELEMNGKWTLFTFTSAGWQLAEILKKQLLQLSCWYV